MRTTALRTEEQKVTKTIRDTILVTPAEAKKWKAPPFQRPIKENRKVFLLAEQMRMDSGVWPGVVTLGKYQNELYIIDGQHRRAAFLISGLLEGYTDVRIHQIGSIAEMGEEFVKLNSQLVRMGPDDILRGLEASMHPLQIIRKFCPYVGYDSVRRGENTPMVSMSSAIRCWWGSGHIIPAASGMSAYDIATAMDDEQAVTLVDFLHLAHAAFGRDPQYYRMWGNVNLTLCMWLYRRLVLEKMPAIKRHAHFTKELFQKCMMSLTADAVYVDWLQGRHLSERDRAPAYNRIRTIFVKRASEELPGQKILMPSESWTTH